MLHGASLSDGVCTEWVSVPYPIDAAQGTASGGIVSAMLAIFSAQFGSLA